MVLYFKNKYGNEILKKYSLNIFKYISVKID